MSHCLIPTLDSCIINFSITYIIAKIDTISQPSKPLSMSTTLFTLRDQFPPFQTLNLVFLLASQIHFFIKVSYKNIVYV